MLVIYFAILATVMLCAIVIALKYGAPKSADKAPTCPKCHAILPLMSVYNQMRAWPFKRQIYCGQCHRRLNITTSKGFWLTLFAHQFGLGLFFMLPILSLLVMTANASHENIFGLIMGVAFLTLTLSLSMILSTRIFSRLIKKHTVFTEDI